MIEKISVVDHNHVEEVFDALAPHLHQYCICNIDIDFVDGNMAILSI